MGQSMKLARFAVAGLLLLVLLLGAATATALAAWRYTEPTWLWPSVALATWALAVMWFANFRRTREHITNWLVAHAPWRAVIAAAVLVTLAGMLSMRCSSPTHDAPPPSEDGRIAIIGAGAAGVAAAWMLQQAGRSYQLYEASGYAGGHAFSAPFDDESGRHHEFDIGFLFGSPQGYQDLKVLMALHGIDPVRGHVAFDASVDGARWSTRQAGVDHAELNRFHAVCEAHWNDDRLAFVPFGWWLTRHRFSDVFRRRYLTPYLTLLFLTPKGFYEYSAQFMASMFAGTDKFLDLREPMRVFSIRGGSSAYYRAVAAGFSDRLRTHEPVVGVQRTANGVVVRSMRNGQLHTESYAGVIVAVGADVALRILDDATSSETAVLSQVRYATSEVVLHTDRSALPDNYEGGYSWRQPESWGDGFELSAELAPIVMPDANVQPAPIGTLNPQRALNDVRVRRRWRHFIQDIWHFVTVYGGLPELQGRANTWFAGSWTSHIGHESAMRSGVRAACRAAMLPATTSGAPATTPSSKTAAEDGPCTSVRVRDELPDKGVTAEDVVICDASDAYAYLWKRHCL